jgi:hypothetical protein
MNKQAFVHKMNTLFQCGLCLTGLLIGLLALPGWAQTVLKAGGALPVTLSNHVDTRIHGVGTPVEAQLSQDMYLGETLLLPRTTRLSGYLETVDPPLEGRNAILRVRFDQLHLPDGRSVSISAYVRTGRADRAWGGELTPGTVPRAVQHRVTGIGEYNKIVYVGKRQMGEHITFDPGERWNVVLEKPVELPAELPVRTRMWLSP